MSRKTDWREYVDENGDFELAMYLFFCIKDLMKSSLDLGTLLSTDHARLRAYKEQVKSIFKGRWLEIAEALESFDIIIPCGCSDEYCEACFSGDTKFITREGIKSFRDTVGTTQLVLSNHNLKRDAGYWIEADIRSFGEQPLRRVVLSRNGITKEIYATPDHVWLVKGVMPGEKNGWQNNREIITDELQEGHRLAHLLFRPQLHHDLSPMGVVHGIVFGDGHNSSDVSTRVTLWGDKDAQLLRFFPEGIATTPVKTINGVEGMQINGLPSHFKTLPTLMEDPDYIMGFLAGYFAADGKVSKKGNISLDCSNKGVLERVRTLAQYVGIATFGIRSYTRTGCSGRGILHDFNIEKYGECSLEMPSEIHSLSFVTSTLKPEFFLIEEHRNRFISVDKAYERLGWVVNSVEKTNRVEEVFCAVVPGTNTFALEDNIWTHNCGGARYRLNSALTPDELREIAVVVGDPEDPKLKMKLEQGLARALDEVYGAK